MASVDAPIVADKVEADGVMSDMYAANSALRDAHVSELPFLRSWSEDDKAVFRKYMAEQEALVKDCTLSELTDKVARQSKLTVLHTVDKCCVVGGKLSLAAQLHGTLHALRKCQAAATLKEQAEKEKLNTTSSNWLQNSLQNQEKATPGLANGTAKKQPAAAGFVPLGGNGKTRGRQLQAAATGYGPLPLASSSRPGGGAFGGDLDRYQGRGTFRSSGGPPGITTEQQPHFEAFKYTEVGKSGGGGGGVLVNVPFGSRKPGAAAAGAGRAKASTASQPSQQTRTTRQRQTKCEGCQLSFAADEVTQSLSMNVKVCKNCERKLHDTKPPPQEKTAFHDALEKAQRPQPKPNKCTEPVHINLLSDSEADADGEDKPLAETRKRPVRAAAAAGQSLSQQLAGLKALYPPTGDTHAVEVSAADLFHLQPSEFLNDTVIDLYLKKLERELTEPLSKRVHFFNTFFYKKLSQRFGKPEGAAGGTVDGFKPNERAAHDRVKKWTKHVDIFSKDFVFVPVHSGLHWSLVIICHPGVVPTSAAADHEIIDIDGEPASKPVAASPVTKEDFQAAAPCAPEDSVIDMDVDADKPAAEDHADLAAPGFAAEPPPAAPPYMAPFVLHLDSMSGGHSPAQISGRLRPYLAMEWERLALSNPESVPGRSGLRTRRFTAETLTVRKLTLPQQNNSSDCGCFLLTYLEHFLKCMPDYLSYEQLKGLEKGKGIKLPNCADFLGEHWFDPMRGFNMRERMTNVILDLFVKQAGEPQDDDARNRLQRATEVLECGLADEARAAEAATAKELKYAEKLQRRAERLAAGPPAPGAALSDSESELPVGFASGKMRSKKKPSTEDAAVAAADAADAAGDEGGEQRRSSGRTRRASRAAAAEDEGDQAPAQSDSEFQPEKPKSGRLEKPPKRRRRLAAAVFDDDDEQEPLQGIAHPSARAKGRSGAAAASAAPPADAIDIKADADDDGGGAPGFVPLVKSPYFSHGAPGFSPEPLGSAGARVSSPPPAAEAAAVAEPWGLPVLFASPRPAPVASPPYFDLVPSQPPEQQPLKPPPPAKAYRRRGSDKAAPDAVERPAAPAQEVITLDDDDVAEDPNGTQSL